MTLKQSVENPHSPLRAFFNARLPNTRTALQAATPGALA